MAVCPKCKKVINELEQVRTGVEKSRFFIKGHFGDYDSESFNSDGDYHEWICYECGETLFGDWEEATEFLKNKDELQELVAEKINMKKEDGNL